MTYVELHEFKTKYISLLALAAENEVEKRIASEIIKKLYRLRCYTLADLSYTLYNAVLNKDVSEKFKEICREALKDVPNVKCR